MVNTKFVKSIAALACSLLMTLSTAQAHHSTAMFDSDNPIELSGTVSEWQFTNPHVFLMLEVEGEGEGEDGQATVWALEGMSPNVIIRRGWTPQSLKPGDKVTATVRPLHSGEPGGNYSNLRWEDGSTIDPQEGRPN